MRRLLIVIALGAVILAVLFFVWTPELSDVQLGG